MAALGSAEKKGVLEDAALSDAVAENLTVLGSVLRQGGRCWAGAADMLMLGVTCACVQQLLNL